MNGLAGRQAHRILRTVAVLATAVLAGCQFLGSPPPQSTAGATPTGEAGATLTVPADQPVGPIGGQPGEQPGAGPTPEPGLPEPTRAPGFAPGTVIFEQVVNIEAVTGAPAELQFDAGPDQAIRIDATLFGGSVDYEMIVADKYGNYLATLRARPGQQSQAISEFNLPFEGPYRLVLSPVDGSGTVKVTVTALGPPSGGGVLEGIPASADAAVNEEAVFHTYRFTLQEGATVTLLAEAEESGSPDLRLSLYGPDGRFVSEADDIAPPANLNAALSRFIAPLTGTYTVIVSNYGTGTGDYTFSITSDTEVPQAEGTADVLYDNPYRAAFVNQSALSLTFDGTIGDILQITVTEPTAALDVDIYLYSPFNQIIAYAVSNLAGSGEALNEVQLPYTGRYRLELRPIGDGEATFTLSRLSVERLTGGGLFGDGGSQTLPGVFTAPNVFHYFQFQAVAGDRITLQVDSTSAAGVDIGFAIIGPSGEQLVFEDDGRNDNVKDPEMIRYFVHQTGMYTVIVYTFNGLNGTYDLEFLRE